jgi:hypothetical protein
MAIIWRQCLFAVCLICRVPYLRVSAKKVTNGLGWANRLQEFAVYPSRNTAIGYTWILKKRSSGQRPRRWSPCCPRHTSPVGLRSSSAIAATVVLKPPAVVVLSLGLLQAEPVGERAGRAARLGRRQEEIAWRRPRMVELIDGRIQP